MASSKLSYTPVNDESVVQTKSLILTKSVQFYSPAPITNTGKKRGKKAEFNDPNFVLNDLNSSIYIVQNNLVKRTLLPYKERVERQISVQCTRYVFLLIFTLLFLVLLIY